MQIITKFVSKLNFIQRIFLTTSSSIILYWLLDGFGLKPLEDVLFRFINIAFSWSFDTKFNLNYTGYLHPDFIFLVSILGLIIFYNQNDGDERED
tara:strand:- start:56 stop:340 length:285 start_codon:yes stop_codon:yes gene_type:complete